MKNRVLRGFCLSVVVGGLLAGVVACGGDGDGPPESEVAVALSEWEIALSPEVVRAGDATFVMSNGGEVAHNLVVVKSDLPPAELPVDASGAVDVSKLNLAGGAGPFAPGQASGASEPYSLEVSAGKYVLFCDVVTQGESHYANGMYASLLVEP